MKKSMILILVILGIVLLSIIVLIAVLFTNYPSQNGIVNEINDFESCVAAGNPVMESYPRQCMHNGVTYVEEIDDLDDGINDNEEGNGNSVEDYFAEQLWQKGTENLGAVPIEGFNPEIYKGAYPGLINQDFHNTEAIGGIWIYDNELTFIKNNEPVTSADGTLTNQGVKTLLANLENRLNTEIETEEQADELIELISQSNDQF